AWLSRIWPGSLRAAAAAVLGPICPAAVPTAAVVPGSVRAAAAAAAALPGPVRPAAAGVVQPVPDVAGVPGRAAVPRRRLRRAPATGQLEHPGPDRHDPRNRRYPAIAVLLAARPRARHPGRSPRLPRP